MGKTPSRTFMIPSASSAWPQSIAPKMSDVLRPRNKHRHKCTPTSSNIANVSQIRKLAIIHHTRLCDKVSGSMRLEYVLRIGRVVVSHGKKISCVSILDGKGVIDAARRWRKT